MTIGFDRTMSRVSKEEGVFVPRSSPEAGSTSPWPERRAASACSPALRVKDRISPVAVEEGPTRLAT